MSGKLATQGLLKVKIFQNKDYGVIRFDHDAINKILLHDSNYDADKVMWPKSGNSNIYIREIIRTSIFIRVWPEKTLFWGVGLNKWVKFSNLTLALVMTSRLYTSLAK